MSEERKEVTDVWPVWEFECPECEEINQLSDGDFSGGECETFCDSCNADLLVHRPDVD